MCCFAASQRRDIAKATRIAKEFEGERAMKKAKAKAKENVTGNVKSNANAKVTYAPLEVADYLDTRRWRRAPVSKRSRP
jgi:phosphotransferase system IIB component